MGVTSLVKELEMGLQESQNQRDKRVEDLWKRLDVQQTGYLDFKGLQRGLRRIDHPLKNADEMLRHMMSRLDDNSDGKIDFEEFRTFVEETEKKLLLLFHTIDRDRNGKLDKNELREAFRKAGLVVPNRKLDAFFNDIDYNNDGYISFGEWRDFLLFMPVHQADAPLAAVLDFYASIVTLTAEGDSMVSEETLEGLGTTGFLLQTLFGSILRIASPWDSSSSTPPSSSSVSGPSPHSQDLSSSSLSPPPYLHEGLEAADPNTASTTTRNSSPTPPRSRPRLPTQQDQGLGAMEAAILQAYATDLDAARAQEERAAIAKSLGLAPEGSPEATTTTSPTAAATHAPFTTTTSSTTAPASATIASTTMSRPRPSSPSDAAASPKTDVGPERPKKIKSKLTTYVPDPGYFLAGAVAGGVSRTATAPLDRLKVYLLVKTQMSTDTALKALRQGRPILALRNAVKPIGDGVQDLWRAGGMRSMFAGNGLNVIKIMPESAIKFGSYEAAKRALAKLEGHDDPKRINSYSKFTAGGIAGMVAQFCVYPLDTLKFRLQTSTVQGGLTGNALVIETAKKMWQAGGLRSAYRGVTMGLIGMFPYSAIDMGTFELLKNSYKRYMVKYHGVHEEDAKPGNIVTGIIGASSGAFGASVVYPLNVLRTRLQTQGTAMHPATYTGIWDVARTTLRNEGVRGMYKGLAPNLLKVAPALSITWVMYENSKRMLGLE